MVLKKIKKNLKLLKPNIHLKVSIEIIRYTGNWPPQKQCHRFAYFIFTALFFNFMVGHFIMEQFVNLIINWRSLSKILTVTPLFMTNIVHAYKYILIIKYQKRIQNMIDITNGPMFSKNNIRYERIMSWYSWHEILHHIVYETVAVLGVIFLALAPVNGYLIGQKQPPLNGCFPYDFSKSPVFEITWFHQIVSLLYCCTSNIAMDVLITGLINAAACQFELLKRNIFTLQNDYNQKHVKHSPELSKQLDDKTYEELSDCIQYNIAIFNFVAEIQDLFGHAICMQLLTNCLIICLTTFYISQVSPFLSANVVGHIVYTCSMVYQIFIYCWHGNELYLQNDSVSSAIYMVDWWKFSERSKRVLHIMMVRTHKPLIIKAGFLMALSLSTYVAIMNMSYSLFAVLRSKVKIT